MTMVSDFDLKTHLTQRQALISYALADLLNRGPSSDLTEAIRYSLLAPGKRLRAVLCLVAGEIAGVTLQSTLPTACAIEMIHTMSLIQDDLPSMDNASVRRGRPAMHIQYGEAMAILAGDALFAQAFELIATQTRDVPAERVLCAIGTLASALSSSGGLANGQALDLKGGSKADTKNAVTIPEINNKHSLHFDDNSHQDANAVLDNLHGLKTAVLFRAATECGAVLAGASKDIQQSLARYGWLFGMAFQCADDLSDIDEDTRGHNSPPRTAVLLMGLTGAQARLKALVAEAKDSVASLGENTASLIALADLCRVRGTP